MTQRSRASLQSSASTDVAKRVAQKLQARRSGRTRRLSRLPSPHFSAMLYDQLKSLLRGGKPEPDPKADLLEPDDPLEQAAKGLQGGVSVTRQGFSYLINVSYTSDNPSRAAAVANGFADEYLVDQLESRYESTRRTNEWLSERLGDLRNKVRESERAVEIFRAENNIVGAEGSTLSDQEVSKLNEQLILARAETAQARANLRPGEGCGEAGC